MLTPSRMFYTATISVGELGVLFSLSVYVVSFVLRWFFYGVFSSFWWLFFSVYGVMAGGRFLSLLCLSCLSGVCERLLQLFVYWVMAFPVIVVFRVFWDWEKPCGYRLRWGFSDSGVLRCLGNGVSWVSRVWMFSDCLWKLGWLSGSLGRRGGSFR